MTQNAGQPRLIEGYTVEGHLSGMNKFDKASARLRKHIRNHSIQLDVNDLMRVIVCENLVGTDAAINFYNETATAHATRARTMRDILNQS